MENIDLKFLRGITDDNEEMITSFIKDFIQDKQQFEETLTDSLKTKNFEQISQAAHYLKSSAKVLGAHLLQQELENLEIQAKSKNLASVQEVSKNIKEIIYLVEKDINNYLEKEN